MVTNTTKMVNIYRKDGYKYYKDGKWLCQFNIDICIYNMLRNTYTTI